MPTTTRPMPLKPHWLKAMASGRPQAIDRDKAVIRGVVLAEEGPFKTPGRGEFDARAITDIVQMVNAKPRGLKSRFTHPSLSDDGLGKYLGRFRDARTEKSVRRLGRTDDARSVSICRADLHFDKTAFDTPSGNLAKYLMDLAESDPDAFSTSLVIEPEELHRIDKRGQPLVDTEGNALPPLWLPKHLHACDVVDEGDATNGFLAAGMSIEGLPDAVVWQAELLLAEQFAGQSREVIESRCQAFLARYLDNHFGPATAAAPTLCGRPIVLTQKRSTLGIQGGIVLGSLPSAPAVALTPEAPRPRLDAARARLREMEAGCGVLSVKKKR